jgi:hypothetical protein
MKTVNTHTVKASSVSAYHSNYEGTTTLTFTEIIGNVETQVRIEMTPAQLKKFIETSGRNALIDAKVLRGSKKY